MEALGERRARSWDGAEDVGRLARTAQPLQIRPPSIFGDRPHGRGVPIFFAEVRPTSGAAIWFSPHLYRARNLVEGTAANPEPAGLPAYGGCGFSASGASVRSCPGSSDDVEPRGHGPCRGRPAIWPGRRRCMRSRCRTAALADGSPWPYRAPRRPALSGATTPQTSHCQRCYAREIATRSGEAGDKSYGDGINSGREDDRNSCGRSLCCQHSRGAVRGNHSHLALDQIGYQRRKLIILAFGPAIFNRHVAALDIAGFTQSLAERTHLVRVWSLIWKAGCASNCQALARQ